MRRFAVFLVFVVALLQGCALTRVSGAAHEKEVAGMNLVGKSQSDAIATLQGAGFRCHPPELGAFSVDGKLQYRSCYKRSAELICPQERHVALIIDRQKDEIISRRNHFQQGCF